jgi:hypothetical protein
MAEQDFTNSTLRERIVEHIFVGDVLRELWQLGVRDVDVLRPEFDAHGYDIVLSRGRIIRHVQLKTQAGGKVGISRALGDKPSGCVVWITIDMRTLKLGPFHWFGGAPGEPLRDISRYPLLKRTTANSKGIRPLRKNHHELPRREFLKLETIDELIRKLFDDIPHPGASH